MHVRVDADVPEAAERENQDEVGRLPADARQRQQLLHRSRHAAAETIEDCEMLVIDRKTFDSLIRGHSEIAVRFIKRLADRLRETNEQMEALMIKDNTSRVVSILAKRVKEQKKTGEFFITIDDLAGLAGIENSHVKMILEKLASVRILELTGDKVHITSQEQMDRLLRYLEMREIFGEIA